MQSGIRNYKTILIIIAISGLLLTIVPSFLNWQGIIQPALVNNLMLAGTILWFVPAVFLFGIKSDVNVDSDD
ncbi:MAG: hypothetical protein ACFCUM_13045 [Bacteroidales bacterium]